MTSVYKVLNNIQTHLIIYGDPFNNGGKDVIVTITGSPGLPDFYREFASELHKSTDMPICVIGQAGHEEVPDIQSNLLKSQEHLFDLEGQLAHKLDLINNHIDKKSRLHLIAHSIGTWELIGILEKNDSVTNRIGSINLLFPTLQRMAETKNGQFLNNIVRPINFIVLFLVKLLSYFPILITKFLIGLYMKIIGCKPNYTDCILKFLKPPVVEKVLFMAYDEMDKVTTLNVEGIKKTKHLLNVIYSTKDDWAPLSYLEEIKKYLSDNQIIIVDIRHSFVFDSSKQVAEMVSDNIIEKASIKK